MRTLEQLLDLEDPGIVLIRQWLQSARNDCTLLPPSAERGEVLGQAQVTTRSTMGAIAYETGGILVDHGWLRFPGSGHPRLTGTLTAWNTDKADRCFFVADDAAGGFFALNGGALGTDLNQVYYWPPDSLEWEPTHLGFSDFLRWALMGDLDMYYSDARWPGWEQDVAQLPADQAFLFYPPLWTREGAAATSHRTAAPIAEVFAARQLFQTLPHDRDAPPDTQPDDAVQPADRSPE